MTIQHSALTGSELHEPKGADSASAGEAYISDGAGSGTWQDPLTGVNNLNEFEANGVIDDLSTANSEYKIRFARAVDVNDIYAVMEAAITGSDATVSLYRDGVLLGQTMPVPVAGSGADVKVTLNLSPSYSFTAGQVLTLRTDGASTGSCKLWLSVSCSVT